MEDVAENRTHEGDREANESCRILDEHGEGRGILACMNRREHGAAARIAHHRAIGDDERIAFERERDAEHDVRPERVFEIVWIDQSVDASEDRDAAADTENQNCHEERPEIKFATVPERMPIVGWPMTPTNSEEKDAFVRRIDEGMDRLRRHRSASGNGGDDGFGDGDGEIDADRDNDGRRAFA